MIHYHFEEIDSTNDVAKSLIKNEKLIAVTANYQTKGKGRNSNRWVGDKSANLYLSFGIKHELQVDLKRIIAFQGMGCLAVKQALNNVCKDDIFRLKYPNDVYANHSGNFKKICGVLVEHGFIGSVCDYSIIGIGLNINQTIFPDIPNINPVSLAMLGYEIEIKEITEKVIEKFKFLNKMNDDQLFDVWVKELNIIGKKIKVLGEDIDYTAIEIFEDGRLRLISEKTERIIDNGDSVRYSLE